jgi:YjbE family integral membrane protein
MLDPEPPRATMDYIFSTTFLVSLLQVIWIDILLSGDNAVVIAMACRSLPVHQRKLGIMLGAGTAVGLRIIFAFLISELLGVPCLRIVGGLLLFWIALKLIQGEDEDAHGNIEASTSLWKAVRTIAIADAVMSLDNVIAIAAAAKGNFLLIVIGLLISIPLIIYGSTLVLKILIRFPILVTFGGGLLGWIAGEIVLSDPAIAHWVESWPHWTHTASAAIGAAFVVVLGKLLARRKEQEKHLVDLAEGQSK